MSEINEQPIPRIYQIDIEQGHQDPKAVPKYMDYILASVRARQGQVLKIWHGNMQTESEGRVRDAVRAYTRKLKRQGRINFFILGEDLCEEDAATRYLLDKHPEFTEKDEHWGYRLDAYVVLYL